MGGRGECRTKTISFKEEGAVFQRSIFDCEAHTSKLSPAVGSVVLPSHG